MLGHNSVDDGQGSHALDDGNGSWYNTGVVAALGGQDTLCCTVVACGRLILANGGGRLEGGAEEDGHAVGDAALDTGRVVRLGVELGAGYAGSLGGSVEGGGGDEGVVVGAALHLSAEEARADLETLDGRDGHDGVGESGLELVEAGLANTRRNVADDAGDGAAGAVVLVFQLRNEVLHAAVGVVVWAADGEILVDLGAGDGVSEAEESGIGAHGIGVAKELDGTDRGDESDNIDVVGLLEPLFGNGTGGHAGNGLAS